MHTRTENDAYCPLCRWSGEGNLETARENVRQYGIALDPHDRRFAPLRHPILAADGTAAIDRVKLRERAYVEFGTFARDAKDCAALPERLVHLLGAITHADELYRF